MIKPFFLSCILLQAILALGFKTLTNAAPGYLDTSFSTDGKVTQDIAGDYDRINRILIQTDGKIVIVGYSNDGTDNDFLLLRYDTDGNLDTTFGTSGIVLTDFDSNSQDFAWGAVLQADGKIVVAGSSDADLALARYTTTGALDSTFGTNGLTTNDFNMGGEGIRDIAIDGSGNFVVVGSKDDGLGTDDDIILARYTSAGVLDTTFGTGGKTIKDFAGYDDAGLALAIQADGKIVVVGGAQPMSLVIDQVIMRFTAAGVLDTTFGTGGITTTDINSDYNGAQDLHILPDGKILVSGYAYIGLPDFTLTRYTDTGSLDTTFGTNGITTTDFFGGQDDNHAMAVQHDGKILLAGTAYTGVPKENFALARYDADGALDSTFGNGGLASTDFLGNSLDTGNAIALQTDGKILVAGLAAPTLADDFDIALARYEGTPISFQPDGIIGNSTDPSRGVGNDIYNTNAANQNLTRVSRKARPVAAVGIVQNDGDATDNFILRGTGGNRYFSVSYFAGINLTANVLSGTLQSGSLNAGEDESLSIQVKPKRSKLRKKIRRNGRVRINWRRKTLIVTLKATSQQDGTKKDAIQLIVKHR